MTGGGAVVRDGAAMRKRSLVIAGHATSISLEDAFWDALRRLARREGRSVAALIAEIDRDRQGSLSSAVRLHVLRALQAELAAAIAAGS